MAERSILDRLLGRPGAAPRQSVPVRQRIARGGPRAEYDGATFGRRAAGWRRTQRDANAELSPAVMAALRGIARDLVRNNPFAARGVATIANNMVGTGITFQVYRNGKIDDALNKKARAHFDTSACDSGGRHDLYGLQLQAARTIVESGAVVMRRRWRRLSDRLPLPVQLQVLEPERIEADLAVVRRAPEAEEERPTLEAEVAYRTWDQALEGALATSCLDWPQIERIERGRRDNRRRGKGNVAVGAEVV